MKTRLVVFCTLIFTASLIADNPKTDAVFLKMVKEYTLKDDGNIIFDYSHKLKLLTYNAFNRHYGETFVTYDTVWQSLSDYESVTTTADGRQVKSPDYAFNKVLPRETGNSAAYNHLREMVITHIGLERNAVVDLSYKLTDKPGFKPGLGKNILLSQDSPVNELTVRVKIPEDKKLHFKLFNSNAKEVISKSGGHTVYEWIFKDLPALISEPQHSAFADFTPYLVFSTNQDYNEALKAFELKMDLSKKIEDHFIDSTFSPVDQALSAQKIVVKEMANIPLNPSVCGYRYRRPIEVWQSSSGTPFEKANLLAAILRKTGLMSRAVLIAENNMIDENAADLSAFNIAAVCVHFESGQSFMLSVESLNNSDLKYIYSGRQMLVFHPDKIELRKVPSPDSELHESLLTANITIGKDAKPEGSLNLALKGAANPYLLIQRENGEADTLLNKINSESILSKSTNLSDSNLEIEGRFKNTSALKEQDNYIFYDLPENAFGIASLKLSTWAAVRTAPLQLPYNSLIEKCVLNIKLADGLTFAGNELEIEKDNETGTLKIKILKTADGLKINRLFKLKKKTISKEEYKDFFELWTLWHTPSFKQVVLKRK